MERLIFVSNLLAALGTALLAGSFFAFSAFLMKALGGLSAERGIVAMQAVTGTARGPLFALVFFGTAVLCVFLLGSTLLRWGAPGSCYLLTGATVFLAGTFSVTMMRNVPLTTQLTAASPDTEQGQALWRRFQTPWTFWNHIRAIAALIACACFILALAEPGNPFGRA